MSVYTHPVHIEIYTFLQQPTTGIKTVVQSNDRDIWDRVGMSLSGICVAHCLLLPVAVSLLPLWTSASAVHNWMHPVFAILLVPTTVIAGFAGFKRHRNVLVLVLLGVGLGIILLTGVVLHEEWGTTREILFTTSGSIVLIAGHLLNWKSRHKPHTGLNERHDAQT